MDVQEDKKVEHNKIVCELCKVVVLNEHQRSEHIMGKKHQLALHQATVLETKEKCGIYVRGFPVTATLDELKLFLSKYGEIVDGFMADNNMFAIIQFKEVTSVQTILQQKEIKFQKQGLVVQKRNIKKKKDPPAELQQWENVESINKYLESIHNLDDQIKALVNILQPNWFIMGTKYDKLCRDIQTHLHEIFPNCIAYPFGSTVSGLSFPSSDVDIYVKVFMVNGSVPNGNLASAYVNMSKKLLQNYPRVFSHVLAIPRANTPIVKCIHNPTRLSCDFNFKNMLGVCNTYMIKHYLAVDTKLSSLMIVLKYWAKVHDLTGRGGKFSNYSLIILFLFYLQVHQHLPCVATVQAISKAVNMQEGWNGGFSAVSKFACKSLANLSSAQILQGFFQYYANFDYALHVICPYLGVVLLKTDFLRPDLLSDKFVLYKANIPTLPPLKIESSICIQDPFQHNHNLSGALHSRFVEDFVNLCKVGALICKNESNNSALYQLFTYACELTATDKFASPNEYQFSLTMDSNCILHLNQLTDSNEEDLTEKTQKMKTAWHELANTFILEFLTKIMKFNVQLKTEDDHFKCRRLDEQNDIHDTVKIETVTYHCTGYFNLWDARKSILKDMNIDPSLGILEKQIQVSEYMSNLYKGQKVTNTILEFDLSAVAEVNPVQLSCTIIKRKALSHNFITFRLFVCRNIHSWFEKYCKELDQNVNK
ncbi:hypothetical protein PPYR_06936 [Photinus pyralis]|uniref:Speckle targeted PIP5K1A-regulated poly(A) polymerase n=1 Tax=Photinus pyralis TaxID=7054 RepID=A0A1Y1K423_PHOPY|nr:speckle targeted PIP5K1A-regulated poly(A) polymerase-like [Photinus pyralis]KAB0799056.1 hypothetical protein PPYR_06936 [Photinus pyralis]